MSIAEYIKGDSTIQGVTVHRKSSWGYEEWSEYNSQGNLVYRRNSNRYECWNGYDSEDNKIYHKDNRGKEYWYDSQGNEYDNPQRIMELTLDEVAEKLGIPVESLRIKK